MAGVPSSLSLAERIALRSMQKDNGCIEWTGHAIGGYGVMRFRGRRMVRPHRAAWEIAHGPIPNGLCVCHRCDNPLCVNVEHLFLGTRADNNKDKTSKGRQARGSRHGLRGEEHPRAKLTAGDVKLIRDMSANGILQRVIADKFNVSRSAISLIVNQVRWRKK